MASRVPMAQAAYNPYLGGGASPPSLPPPPGAEPPSHSELLQQQQQQQQQLQQLQQRAQPPPSPPMPPSQSPPPHPPAPGALPRLKNSRRHDQHWLEKQSHVGNAEDRKLVIRSVERLCHAFYDKSKGQVAGDIPDEWRSAVLGSEQFSLPLSMQECERSPGYTAGIPSVLEALKEHILATEGLAAEGIFRLAPDDKQSGEAKTLLNRRGAARALRLLTARQVGSFNVSVPEPDPEDGEDDDDDDDEGDEYDDDGGFEIEFVQQAPNADPFQHTWGASRRPVPTVASHELAAPDMDDLIASISAMPPLDCYNAANLVKVFFREQPTPLLADLDQQTLLRVQTVAQVPAALKGLRDPKLSVFLWLLDFMVEVARSQRLNLMGPENLAIVFTPNLFILKPPPGADPLLVMRVMKSFSDFLALCIRHRGNLGEKEA